jgi:tRNA pseudouridine13 synthase
MKTLYCHALQSYVWNLIISRRLREHGLKLVEGDIVGVKKGNNASKKEE